MFKIITEVDVYLVRTALWSGARENVELLFDSEIEQILDCLEDCCYDCSWTLTTLNDFFWFDTDCWAEWIGYENFDVFYSERSEYRKNLLGE